MCYFLICVMLIICCIKLAAERLPVQLKKKEKKKEKEEKGKKKFV